MKKIIKGLILSIIMGVMVLGSSVVFADTSNDGSVIGTANLNGTAQNSAKVGDKLEAPEIGWKRYDDTNSRIIYNGTWVVGTDSNNYYSKQVYSNDTSSKISFKFYGSKIRIIAPWASIGSKNISVTIDSTPYAMSEYTSYTIYQRLSLDISSLDLKVHTVTISCLDTSTIFFDAIDINDTGYLIDPSTMLAAGLSLDKTSLAMKENETSSLTATVTPENATNKSVTWKSSDPTMATVNDSGKITGIKEGTANITATTTDGSNLSATCVVTVTKSTTPNNPTTVGDRATLTINMNNGPIKQYDLSASELTDFLTWYDNRSKGTAASYYVFNVPASGPYLNKKDYISFDKINDYEVQEYNSIK